ncbi:MAG: TonB-dependent receptor [Methylomonas sp.]|jgi:iron complex outermembrane receptor protein|uniref:TonB-dependent siderophore receptor n=1 Tax=Methylomonas sp. TaxID=418 RepID=UPI0025F03788|nr:TonB-dependent receptor [Methylomonas sp.]MCK9609256.1 TonB-dependent receptor [Methylomonas sp.]
MSHTHRRCNPGSRPSRLSHAIQGILLASALTASVAAHGEETTNRKSYHISGGSLGQALSQFARDAGILFTGESKLTDGKTSKGLDGEYTVEEGFRKLLAGSGLTYTITADNSVAIKVAESGSDAASTLPAVKVTGQAVYDENDPYNKSYTVTNSTTATKTDTPIFDTPVSIQVVPRVVMNDQKATTIKDALENVSSIRPQSSLGLSNGYIVRGFRNGRIYRNGLVANGLGIGEGAQFDSANLERVEVLKGPAAVLFGRIEPGGLINLVTKKPRDEAYHSVEQRFGSYDFYRTEWDATDAITDDKSLSYRFTGSYQNNKSFRDFNFNDRVLVNPSLTWRPSDATEISLDLEALHEDYQVDRGLFAIGNRPAPIPVSRSFIDPNDPVDTNSKVNLGFNLTHAINENWTLRNRFLASFVYDKNTSVKPANGFTVTQFLDPSTGNRTYSRNIFSQTSNNETYTTNLDLTGKFDLWGVNHQTLVGLDYLRAVGTYEFYGDYQNPVPGLEIDIYNPVYGIDPSYYANALATPSDGGANNYLFRDDWYGVYFQDHITLWDKVHILGGGRYDWARTGLGIGNSSSAADAALPSRRDEGFSPRVGLLYQPWTWVSVYGNWTTSFGANNGVTSAGTTINPEIGEQFEAGLKTEFFDQRLTTTLAYYHLTKENLMTRDFNSPDPFASAAIGKARSQGIELDMTGQITDELSIVGNYAFTDARITKDFSGLQGNRLNNVPEHSGSLWLKYDIRHYEPLNGWQFGVGVFAVGQRQGDNDNTFVLPGYARLDAFTAYHYPIGGGKQLTVQFNIRNLLDKTYYESTDPFQNAPPRVGIYPGAPLTAMGSIRLEF